MASTAGPCPSTRGRRRSSPLDRPGSSPRSQVARARHHAVPAAGGGRRWTLAARRPAQPRRRDPRSTGDRSTGGSPFSSALRRRPRDAIRARRWAGITALQAAGLEGIADDGLDPRLRAEVVPPDLADRRRPASTRHGAGGTTTSSRSRHPADRPEVATVQAALWARTDREAALLLVAPVQQRLTTADAVAEVLDRVRRDRRTVTAPGRAAGRRRTVSAHSTSSTSPAMCRRRGLPEPDRRSSSGRPTGARTSTSAGDGGGWSSRSTASVICGPIAGSTTASATTRSRSPATWCSAIPSLGLRLDPAAPPRRRRARPPPGRLALSRPRRRAVATLTPGRPHVRASDDRICGRRLSCDAATSADSSGSATTSDVRTLRGGRAGYGRPAKGIVLPQRIDVVRRGSPGLEASMIWPPPAQMATW